MAELPCRARSRTLEHRHGAKKRHSRVLGSMSILISAQHSLHDFIGISAACWISKWALANIQHLAILTMTQVSRDEERDELRHAKGKPVNPPYTIYELATYDDQNVLNDMINRPCGSTGMRFTSNSVLTDLSISGARLPS